MTGRVLPFPSVLRAPLRERVTEYGFARIVAFCGLGNLAPRTQIDQLRLLARDEGLPLPKNPRFWAGQRQVGPASIGRNSVWDAPAFDLWRTTRGTNDAPRPMSSARHPAEAAPSLRAAMQNRARALKVRR